MPSERTSSAIRLAERQVGRAVVAVPGGLVHLRGPLMCLGGASMTSCCGQVRLARPDVCLIGVACRRESITFSDLTAGSQSCAELTEVFDPSRPAPGFLWVEDLVAGRHVTSLPRVARVRAGDLAIVGARSTDREGPKVMRTCVPMAPVFKATVTNLTSPRVASITPLGWTTSIKATKGRDK